MVVGARSPQTESSIAWAWHGDVVQCIRQASKPSSVKTEGMTVMVTTTIQVIPLPPDVVVSGEGTRDVEITKHPQIVAWSLVGRQIRPAGCTGALNKPRALPRRTRDLHLV